MLAPPPRPLTLHRRKVVLIASLVAGVFEILGLLGALPRVHIGRLLISPSVIPAVVIVALLGRRAAGKARDIDAAAMYWVTAIAGICVSMVLLDREHHLVDTFALLIAALDEEIVYRFAVPAIVAAILVSFRVPSRPARVLGLVVAATWFVLLPGHRTQVHTAFDVLPFIAFAALSAMVVYRSGSLLATTATHALMNMLTIISFGGDMTRPARGIATGVLLLLLVSGYGFVRPRSAEQDDSQNDDGTVIDLRDGVPPSVVHGGRTPVPVLQPVETRPEDADTRRFSG